MAEEHDEECTCIPEDAIITSVLHVIEWLDPETGETFKSDFSHDGAGEELDYDKILSLTEFARMVYQAPFLVDLVRQFVFGDDE
jgi:hypothetical protein